LKNQDGTYHTIHVTAAASSWWRGYERSTTVKEKVAMGLRAISSSIDESLGLNMTKDACVSTVLIIVCEACWLILARSRSVCGLLEAKNACFCQRKKLGKLPADPLRTSNSSRLSPKELLPSPSLLIFCGYGIHQFGVIGFARSTIYDVWYHGHHLSARVSQHRTSTAYLTFPLKLMGTQRKRWSLAGPSFLAFRE